MVRVATMFVLLLAMLPIRREAYAQWYPMGAISGGNVTDICRNDQGIFANTYQGKLYALTSNRTIWSLQSSSFFYSIAASRKSIYGTSWHSQLQKSSDAGLTWTALPVITTDVAVVKDVVLALGDSLFRSTNDGATWSLTIPPLGSTRITSLMVADTLAFVGTDSGYCVSFDCGVTWSRVQAFPSGTWITSIAACGSLLFGGIGVDGGVYRICKSSDRGISWSPLADSLGRELLITPRVYSNGHAVFAYNPASYYSKGGLYKSTDQGLTWVRADSGIYRGASIWTWERSGDSLFLGTASGIFLSVDEGGLWRKFDAGIAEDAITGAVALPNRLMISTKCSGILVYDEGTSQWSRSAQGIDNPPVSDLCMTQQTVWACGDAGVLRSTNQGQTWQCVNTTTSERLAASSNNIWACNATYGSLVLGYSSNGGTNWVSPNLPVVPQPQSTVDLSAWGTRLAIAWSANVGVQSYAGLYYSDDKGVTLTPAVTPPRNLDSCHFTAFLEADSLVFLYGNRFGLCVSYDHGASWFDRMVGLPSNIQSFNFIANGRFMAASGTLSSGLFYSTDYGATWLKSWLAPPSGATYMRMVALTATRLYVRCSNGLWYTQLPLTDISNPATESAVPAVVALHQNYPNPFNPSTTIRYALPSRSQVTLTIYNTLGQIVREVVNDEMNAGYHEVQFDASNLASGLYFYRMRAGGFTETKRLLLLR